MGLKIGNTTINNVKIGDTQVNKVYIGNTLIWQFETGGSSYSSELQSIIDEATLLGFTLPNEVTLTLIDNLIIDMKSSGFWSLQDVLYNWSYKNTALYNFGTINWKNPSGAKGFSVGGQVQMLNNGLKGNLSNYFDTNFTPSVNGVNYTLNTASRTFIVSTSDAVNGSRIDGNADGNNLCFAGVSTSANRINTVSNYSGGNIIMGQIGLNNINRRAISSVRFYRANSFFNRTVTATILPTSSQRVFNDQSTYSDPIIAFYSMGGILTDLQITSLKASYNTYLTAIGLSAIA